MAIFLISDIHFGHEKIIQYCDRPFDSASQMDECIFDNWAASVSPSDTVYHLGDVCFGRAEQVTRTVQRIKALPGKKYLVPGNHDTWHPEILAEAFEEVLPPIFETVLVGDSKKYRTVLSHYPLQVWNGIYRGAIQLFGHVHGRIPGNSLQMDVGVDFWGFSPVRLETVVGRLKSLPKYASPEVRPGWEDEE